MVRFVSEIEPAKQYDVCRIALRTLQSKIMRNLWTSLRIGIRVFEICSLGPVIPCLARAGGVLLWDNTPLICKSNFGFETLSQVMSGIAGRLSANSWADDTFLNSLAMWSANICFRDRAKSV
jgi:hypothetical protein